MLKSHASSCYLGNIKVEYFSHNKHCETLRLGYMKIVLKKLCSGNIIMTQVFPKTLKRETKKKRMVFNLLNKNGVIEFGFSGVRYRSHEIKFVQDRRTV